MKRRRIAPAMLVAAVFLLAAGASQPGAPDVFSKSNLVAWCIVPFDVRNRGPVERAEMLKGLGITKLAYDWREGHIPSFDQELDTLDKYGIRLQAFWLTSGPDPAGEKDVGIVLDLLRRHHAKTQIWYLFLPPKGFESLTQERKVETAAGAVRYLAEQASQIGCSVGLYNHAGWFGEPENQLAILDRLGMRNVGLVYNFNHAQDQIDRFPAFFPKIEPHLIALNLAGLRRGSSKIYPIGEGGSETEMIRIIQHSRYRGPIGIINEDTDPDAEAGLKKNIQGLRKVLATLGDRAALRTY
jgi:sugar phosphate isomerase/epimerase